MHHHAYLWAGPKDRFDQEALRRPPHPDPPPAESKPEVILRYREVATEFPTSDLPPIETAYWLVKPRSLVRGTWPDPDAAAGWLSDRLAEYAPRFASVAARSGTRLKALAVSAAEQLGAGVTSRSASTSNVPRISRWPWSPAPPTAGCRRFPARSVPERKGAR